jgi:hypothetical protein
MQCPQCSALCTDVDRYCPGCQRSLGKGLTQRKVANFTALVFGLLMVVFVNYMSVSRPGGRDDVAAIAITNGLFIGGAVVIGRIVGWLLGAFICRQ